MKNLNPALIKTVSTALKGKKLEKLMASVQVINDSLAQGGWVLRGSVKANAGFYQGIIKIHFDRNYSCRGKEEWAQAVASDLTFCFNYGRGYHGDLAIALKTLRAGKTRSGDTVNLKLSDEVSAAWVALCNEKEEAVEFLNEARPLPTRTAIGLSPKVIFTLMDLDLDLPTLRMADLDFKLVPLLDENFKPKIDHHTKKPIMVREYFVVWTNGIVHNQSRFVHGCQACGKNIPSGRYVPVEVKDNKSGKLISMWLGCDCSRNIFGIKDVGVTRT